MGVSVALCLAADQRVQECRHGGGRRDVGAHRDGIDERAENGIGAWQPGRPSGDGLSEHDVRLAAVARQHECPGGLQRRGEGNALCAAERHQGGGAVGVDRSGADRIGPLGFTTLGDIACGERCGGGEARQCLAPEALTVGGGLLLQPPHVPSKLRWFCACVRRFGVPGEQFFQQGPKAPPVEQQVVVAPAE